MAGNGGKWWEDGGKWWEDGGKWWEMVAKVVS